jgi:tRNA threonylcarbamoyl adenosine modification protein YeaZ
VSEPGLVAIECSTCEASLAAWRGEFLFDDHFSSDRRHNARIFEPLGRLMGRLGQAAPACVLVGSGPGSYTGTRVGIAAAHGIGIARGCPVIGVPSLLATAEARGGGPVLFVGDARRGAWWHAQVDGGWLARDPEICGADELAGSVAAARGGRVPVVSFDPPPRLGLPAELERQVVAGRPTARRLIEAWLEMPADRRQALGRVPAEPLYLRPPHITEARAGHPLLRKPRA